MNLQEDITAVLTEAFPESGYDLVSLSDGSVTHFSAERILVGCREDVCDFVILQDPKNHRVSREHAYLYIIEGKIFAEDISVNGTFLGSSETADKEMFRLPKHTRTEVRDGQILRFADRKYRVRYTKK